MSSLRDMPVCQLSSAEQLSLRVQNTENFLSNHIGHHRSEKPRVVSKFLSLNAPNIRERRRVSAGKDRVYVGKQPQTLRPGLRKWIAGIMRCLTFLLVEVWYRFQIQLGCVLTKFVQVAQRHVPVTQNQTAHNSYHKRLLHGSRVSPI